MSERPQNKYLKPFKPKGEQPMAGRLFVRVTKDIEQAVKALPNSPEWLRRVITTAAQKELLQGTGKENQEPSPPPDSPPLVDADNLVQIITEVLAVPRLPAAAKKKLESLLETLSQSQGRLPLG